MRYFFITQDKNLPGSIQYRDFDINGSRHVFSKEDSSQLDSVVALYLAGDGNEARWDFLQHPVTMFSRRFRNILDAYEPGLFFQEVVLIHKESSRQYRYVHTLMDQLDAVGSQTEYYPNGTVKRLVLDSGKIGQHNLFLLKGNQRKDPIVSLPLAESLLRRRPMGIHFEEVWENWRMHRILPMRISSQRGMLLRRLGKELLPPMKRYVWQRKSI